VASEDDGLTFFTEGARPESTGKPSVFAQVDQDELIARIGTVDDDMSSPFFKESLLEAEGAATQVFDIGIRLLAEVPVGRLGDPERTPEPKPSTSTRAVQNRNALTVTSTPIAISGVLSRDNEARRAFILGGPDAL